MAGNAGSKKNGHSVTHPMRFPAFITLALTITSCNRCAGGPLIYAAVIDGLERRFDPLPLAPEGLQAAVAAGRWVAVVRPWGHPLAHRAKPGHWWVLGIGEDFRPTLLAEHAHDTQPLPFDLELSLALLPRFIPEAVVRPDDAPPPF